MEYDAFSSTSTQATSPCDICGRNFNTEALTRHRPICAKNNSKKRKVFDSSNQRADGTELKQFQKGQKFRPQASVPKARQAAPPAKKSNWRQTHSDFINAIRGAKGVQQAIDRGDPLPPPPPPTLNPDYVQCPHCDRRFKDTAAQRHIPFCKEQHERLPNKNKPSNQAIQRAQARQYKSPKMRQSVMTSPPGSGNAASYNSNARTASNPGMVRSGNNNSSYNSSPPYGHDNGNSGGGGRALRTGRTAETYSEARQLSAKQRNSMPAKSSQYPGGTNTGPTYGAGGHMRNGDVGYFSGDSDTHRGAKVTGRMGSGAARFCHECGTKYPVIAAKFCCECGIKRMSMT